MSDDEADPELLALLRQSPGLGSTASKAAPTTGVLKSAEYIYDNSIDVSIVSQATRKAAETVWHAMQKKQYSTQTWSEHELHPKGKDENTVNFIFTMNLLNFSFWSEFPADQRFAIEHNDQRWTGYWSLVAALQRALDEGIPITTPTYWATASDAEISHVFRSATEESIPLLKERIAILREASQVLFEHFDGKPSEVIAQASNSAARLVNILAEHFPNFADSHLFRNHNVNIYKRAQILVADMWACFNGTLYGEFHDINTLTMFADYRIPQMLQSLGMLWYSPRLEYKIKHKESLKCGEDLEMEIRGCSIWAVELLRREIVRQHPEADTTLNAVLIDFFLYDTCKEEERQREQSRIEDEVLPHHRTRSIFY